MFPLAALVMVTPGLALFSGASITTMMVLAASWALVLGFWERQSPPMPPGPVIRFLTVAVVWMAVTCLWTPTALGHAMGTTASVIILAALGLATVGTIAHMDEARLRVVRWAILFGVFVGAFILAIELASGHALTRLLFPSSTRLDSMISRGTAFLALLIWPTLSQLPARWAIPAFAVLATLVTAEGKLSIILGLSAGSVAYVAARYKTIWSSRIIGAVMVATILAAPAASAFLPEVRDGLADRNTSALHRLIIWSFTRDRITEHPLKGWGMDASRTIPGADEEKLVSLISSQGEARVQNFSLLPLHPHNGVLQLWLELGLPGAMLGAILAWGLCRHAPHTSRPPLTLATLATGFVLSNLSYGLWQSWWQASFWMTTLIFAATAPRMPDVRP